MRMWIVAFVMAAPLTSLDAQTLAVGDRIRLTVYEAQRQWEGPSRRLVLRGEVTRILPDSIYLKPASLTSELSIPTTAIKSLQRSRGVSRSASAARAAFFGASIFAAYAFLLYSDDRPVFGANHRDAAVGRSAAVGAASGLVVGLVFPSESWRRLKDWNR